MSQLVTAANGASNQGNTSFLEQTIGTPRKKSCRCDRNWISFWFIGMINNLPYCVVMAGAKKIADGFGESNLMPLLTWALVICGVFVRMLNAFVLNGTSFVPRFCVFAVGTTTGLVCISQAASVGSTGGAHFAFTTFGVLVLGCACSFGESTALGYMHRFPPYLVGAFSSGTGMSGVLGSALFIVLQSAGMSSGTIFLWLNVAVGIYLVAFFCWRTRTYCKEIQR